MNAADNLRNNIIDKLNPDYLAALYQLVEKSSVSTDMVNLSEEQKVMLQLSEQDITNGRIFTQEEIDHADRKWLNEV